MYKPRTLLARRRLIAVIIILGALISVSFVNDLGRTVAEVGTTTAVVGIAQTKDDLGNVVEHPTDAQIDAAVREAVALAGGLPENVGPGKKIIIHPNMVEAGWNYDDPLEVGVCTHRQVIRTLIHMCLDAGAEIENVTVCEGSAGFHGDMEGYSARRATRKAFRDTGLDLDGNMIEDQTGAKLLDANYAGDYYINGVPHVYPNYPGYLGDYDSNYVTQIIRPEGFLVERRYYVPNALAQCDVLIRVPVLKNHDLAGLTAGLKLAFGTAPSDIYHAFWLENMKWNLLHQTDNTPWSNISELTNNTCGMVDMTFCRVPDMVVVDGLVGIMSGPTRILSGKTEPEKPDPYMSCIIAGRNVVAVDSICSLAIGYMYTSIPGIREAAANGLGPKDPGLIEVRGAHVKDVRRWFPQWAKNPDGSLSTTVGVPGERNLPTLAGINVANGTVVYGSLLVNPISPDHPGGAKYLCKAELSVDGAVVDSNNVSPYTTTWTAADPGWHIIKYTLYDTMLDEVSVERAVQVHSGDPIAGALGQPENTAVCIGPMVYMGAAYALDNQTFFVSSPDGIRGLRARYSSTTPPITPFTQVSLYGTMSTIDGQRTLMCSAYTTYPGSIQVKPRLFRNRDLGGTGFGAYTFGVTGGTGPYNLGCLVKTTGIVTAGGSDYFWIDDGSLATDPAGTAKLKVQCGSFAQPAPGSCVSVTGFSCTENDSSVIRRMLVLRSPADIRSY